MIYQKKYHLFGSLSIAKQLSLTVAFNTVIASIFYAASDPPNFLGNLYASQVFGLSIFSSIHALYWLRFKFTQRDNMTFILTILGLMVGVTVGLSILTINSAVYQGINWFEMVQQYYQDVIQSAFIALIFGTIIINFFTSRDRIAKAESALQEHRISLLDSEKRMLESNLKRLQSQIEPHFLFNTLSNIIGLVDQSPARAKSMLESLTHYLRATLAYTRIESATLEDELDMIGAYLAIYKERMGDRLQYDINVNSDLHKMKFPPMLLQPLVENAIKHGLEPTIEGGYINIGGNYHNDMIHLIVVDSGKGLSEEVGKGVGLANVQQRLTAIYGDTASLLLEDNQPTGLKTTIEVPREAYSSNNR